MYPFKAVLIGEATKLQTVQPELQAVKVEIEATFADVEATLAWLSQAPEGQRFFVIYVAGPEPLDEVTRLHAGCRGQPILALTGEAVDKEALIRLMRTGVDQAVMLPLQPGDLRAALDSLARPAGAASGRRFATVAVVGVSPGSGVTTVAVNLAFEVAHQGRDCVLVEAVTRLGKLASELGATPRFTTRELALAGDRLDAHMVEQTLAPVTEHLRLLAAPAEELQALDPGAETIRKVLMFLRQLAEYSILEMSYNLTKTFYAGLAAVDLVLVLSRHTPSALQDLKLMCQSLRRDHGVRTLYPVINRFDRHNQDLSLAQTQEALEEPRLLTIAADRSLSGQSITGLKVLRQKNFSGPALEDIQTIARLVLGEPEVQHAKKNGLFGWLKRVFG